jgi:hypothetical protein
LDSEYWVEINLSAKLEMQDAILLDRLQPYVMKLAADGKLVSFHYFREPEIRFRIRLKDERTKTRQKESLAKLANSLLKEGLVPEWHFGNHGEPGREYVGETDRYGVHGWKVAQEYFQHGSQVALELLALKRKGSLENPLWAKGLGNPWEGGDRNPWREREEDPLLYHWSRYVHLFTNQLGFGIDEESGLCAKQSERYARISKDFGLKW